MTESGKLYNLTEDKKNCLGAMYNWLKGLKGFNNNDKTRYIIENVLYLYYRAFKNSQNLNDIRIRTLHTTRLLKKKRLTSNNNYNKIVFVL